MQQARQPPQQQAGSSVTQTESVPTAGPSDAGTLRLRGHHAERTKDDKGVKWVEGTVDNEGLGRKKSKICCIYHKPRPFDESSDESSSDEEHRREDTAQPSSGSRPKGKGKSHGHKHSESCNGDSGKGSSQPNKLDGGGVRS